MTPAELESLAHRRLRGLPEPKAPATLLPRVLREVEQVVRRPWYRRAWRRWPVGWQAISIVAILAMVTFGRTGIARVDVPVAPMITVAGVLWRLVLEPNAPYLALLACSMAVAGTVYCAAISRLLWEGISKR